MRLGNFSKVVAVAATVIWATGCSTTSTTSDSSDAMDQTAQDTQDSASSMGAGSDSSMSGGDMAGQSQGMSEADVAQLSTVFYFDFDKAVIQSSDLDDLNAHAKYLSENGMARVVLEGHADERGTREYNMALGERRAKAVARYLGVQGVAAGQIETVSYGEERPAMVGHDESSWSKNRRVELRYER
ncbi:peptidoglycan-associated lipoprotein Pal [Motiliproteus sediminis]|uniref:peptidoglycan-associated lipoprotein Pal n=1 Tax=Motiliproteus sediminis TaxID=1468178 RepID=UPI001AEFE6B3|nr:peptidoglycan-associated lipoprotein Pal [Motiliproteus sediminis]